MAQDSSPSGFCLALWMSSWPAGGPGQSLLTNAYIGWLLPIPFFILTVWTWRIRTISSYIVSVLITPAASYIRPCILLFLFHTVISLLLLSCPRKVFLISYNFPLVFWLVLFLTYSNSCSIATLYSTSLGLFETTRLGEAQQVSVFLPTYLYNCDKRE